METLAKLVAPIPVDEFLADFLHSQPVVMRSGHGLHEGLFSWEALNRILSEHRLFPPRLRAVQKGRSAEELAFIITSGAVGTSPRSRIDLPQLYRLLQDGASLVLDNVDELTAPLTAFCEDLGRDFGGTIAVDAYAVFGTDPGFGVHFDREDVFALQISGSKRWRVYRPTRPFPLRDETTSGSLPSEADLLLDEVIHPGDVIYVPRGFWHDVIGLGEPSLHLSCGYSSVTGADYLEWLTGLLNDESLTRMDLLCHGPVADADERGSELIARLTALATEKPVSAYFAHRRATRKPRPNPALPLAVTGALREAELVFQLASLTCGLQPSPTDQTITMASGGRVLEMDNKATWLLEQLARGKILKLTEVLADNRNTLGKAATRLTIDRLLREGLIRLHSPDA